MAQPTPMPESAASPGLAARVSDWVFGYDFFLSYSHGDGLNYPRALKQRLERAGFRVFLDQTDYVAGLDLRRETRRQVLKSRQFVIVGRPAALKSVWVMREVEVALASGRIPVIIDLNNSVASAPDTSPLAVMARDSHWLRINETAPDLDAAPSDRTVAELERGFSHTRQESKRQRIFASAAAVLAVTAIVAIWQAISANLARDLAEAQRDRAQRILGQVVATSNRRVQTIAASVRETRIAAPTDAQDDAAAASLAALPPDARTEAANAMLAQSAALKSRGRISEAGRIVDSLVTALLTARATTAGEAGLNAALYRAHDQSIDLRAAVGNFADATRAAASALELAEAQAALDPAAWNPRVAASRSKLCALAQQDGRHDEAHTQCRTAIDSLRAIENPTSAQRQLLAATLAAAADLTATGPNGDTAAEAAYAESLEILNDLNAANPGRLSILEEQSTVLQSLADLALQQKKYPEALTWIDRDLKISRQLAQSGAPARSRDLASSLDRRARILQRLDRPDDAIAAYEDGIQVMERVIADPDVVPSWHRDAATLMENAGRLMGGYGRPQQAVSLLRRAIGLRESLAAGREDPRWQREVEVAYRSASEAMLAMDRAEDALEIAEQYLLSTSLAPDADARKAEYIGRALGTLSWTAVNAHNLPRALWAGEQATVLAPNLAWVHLNYAHALLLSGRATEARSIYFDPARLDGAAGQTWKESIRKDFAVLQRRRWPDAGMTDVVASLN